MCKIVVSYVVGLNYVSGILSAIRKVRQSAVTIYIFLDDDVDDFIGPEMVTVRHTDRL